MPGDAGHDSGHGYARTQAYPHMQALAIANTPVQAQVHGQMLAQAQEQAQAQMRTKTPAQA